jgi:transposase
LRDPLTTQQRADILKLVVQKGWTQSAAAAKVGVSHVTVSRVLKRQRDGGDAGEAPGAAGGDTTPVPVKRARTSKGGRKSSLTPSKLARIAAACDADPFGTVALLHRELQDQGLECSLSTLYRHLDDAGVHRMAVNNYAVWTPSLVHGVYNWIDAIGAALDRKEITFHNLAYMDQTPVHILMGKRGGYSSQKIFGECGDIHGAKKIGNLWAVVTVAGPIRVWFTAENGDDKTCAEFFLSETLPSGWTNVCGEEGNIFEILREHGRRCHRKMGKHKSMVMCLDRMGKSGASHWAVSGHHMPEIRARALKACVGLGNLPPKGAEVNPVELFNCLFKRTLALLPPPSGGSDQYGHRLRGPRSSDECLAMMPTAVAGITEDAYRAFFHKRCRGSDATERFNRSDVAQRVREEREQNKVAPYDWVKEAVAERGYTTAPADWYPASWAVAETYNVYYWRHQLLGLAGGLEAPFQRPIDEADAHERTCRLCSGKGKYAQLRSTRCLMCATCTGTFHHECVGVVEESDDEDDNWDCPCCTQGGALTPRVWKAPSHTGATAVKAAAGGKRKGKRRAHDGSDSDDSAQ